MARTQNRPLPSGRLHFVWAVVTGSVLDPLGLQLRRIWKPITLFLGVPMSFLYVLVYTPMKTASWLSLPVGAIPGALPGLLLQRRYGHA